MAPEPDNKVPKPPKRIVVCCDGTWVNSDYGYDDKKQKITAPSNVTRFARALSKGAYEGQPNQLIYYQAGVGSTGGELAQIVGGATGAGLAENIREAYAFIASNYVPGDELFLLGFSRGAFTARSIAGMITTIGILTRSGMEHFYRIFKDYENMNVDSYTRSDVNDPAVRGLDAFLPIAGSDGSKYATNQPGYINFLLNFTDVNGKLKPLTIYDKENPQIKAIGVWDTVGSLGIPQTVKLEWLKTQLGMNTLKDELKFYDTNLAPRVQYAFHALALEEGRYNFQPAIWSRPATTKSTKLKQVWFPGVHATIGGGTDDSEINDISLAWMMDQLSPHLNFDPDYCRDTLFQLPPVNNDASLPYQRWACGAIDSKGSFPTNVLYAVAGNHVVRTPGQYCVVDPQTGKVTDRPLVDTQERVHPAVRIRLLRNGLVPNLGVDGKGGYAAEALTPHDGITAWWQGNSRHGWTLERVPSPSSSTVSSDDAAIILSLEGDFTSNDAKPKDPPATWLWRSKAKGDKHSEGFAKIMLEEPILGEEARFQRMVMNLSQDDTGVLVHLLADGGDVPAPFKVQ